MALPVGMKCLKYLIFIFNFFFWLAGTAVMAIGLWLKLDPKTKFLFKGPGSPYVFYTGVYILIGAGVLMMVVCFLGCCGAIRLSPWMLGLFFFFLLIIFAIDIAAGLWGFLKQSKVVNDISAFYRQTYDEYKKTRDERLKETLRLIQNGFNCCGPKGIIETELDLCPRAESLDKFIMKVLPKRTNTPGISTTDRGGHRGGHTRGRGYRLPRYQNSSRDRYRYQFSRPQHQSPHPYYGGPSAGKRQWGHMAQPGCPDGPHMGYVWAANIGPKWVCPRVPWRPHLYSPHGPHVGSTWA